MRCPQRAAEVSWRPGGRRRGEDTPPYQPQVHEEERCEIAGARYCWQPAREHMNPVRLARLGMVWIGLWLTALLPLLATATHAEHSFKPAAPPAYLYTGEQIDPDLGMYYLRARYYQPAIGRFWTMDSYEGETEEPASLHKYLYCHANPLNGTDPSGQMNLSMNMASISIAVAGIGQQASKYISRVPSMAKEAFSNGGPAIGRFFNQFGDKVNGYAHKVIELVPGVEILESRLAGCTRIPDFHLRFSNLRMVLEAKYRLPPAGEALTRLGAQLQQFSQWSSQGTGREVVVWALKRPDNASRAEEVVLRAAGSPNGVRFLYGVEELFQHLMTCAGL